ncbi:MAG: hypothetical protein CBE00_02720 [Planctomycetaceae bacterium TMED240]|nr:hypothetical protein [Rhodopirellula sp.]OUX08095.1 MAG: hypothetical protein CBE00_02720 [Planctomycetaceae bacterium TMED240]
MNSLQRFLPSFLCCVIALGYAPAWLHVSVCHDHHAATGDEKADISCLSSCSHTHDSLPQNAESEGSQPADDQSNEHGSETCFICQSLGNANGLTLQWDADLSPEFLSSPTCSCNELTFVEAPLLLTGPRGPPALA